MFGARKQNKRILEESTSNVPKKARIDNKPMFVTNVLRFNPLRAVINLPYRLYKWFYPSSMKNSDEVLERENAKLTKSNEKLKKNEELTKSNEELTKTKEKLTESNQGFQKIVAKKNTDNMQLVHKSPQPTTTTYDFEVDDKNSSLVECNTIRKSRRKNYVPKKYQKCGTKIYNKEAATICKFISADILKLAIIEAETKENQESMSKMRSSFINAKPCNVPDKNITHKTTLTSKNVQNEPQASHSEILSPPSLERNNCIICEGVPLQIRNRNTLLRHFSRFGGIKDIEVNQENTIIRFEDSASARLAKENGSFVMNDVLPIPSIRCFYDNSCTIDTIGSNAIKENKVKCGKSKLPIPCNKANNNLFK